MSKQVQLKFKKLIKKAEFVHADLEYHEELISEAKQGFFAAVEEIYSLLPGDVRSRLAEYKNSQHDQQQEETIADEMLDGDPELQRDLVRNEETLCTEDNPDGVGPGLDGAAAGPTDAKSSEIKKLFHKIAAVAHPDKTSLKGLHPGEAARLEELFKKATEAYNNNNWYILYSVATDLNIDITNPSEDHIDWLEEDIKSTFGRISKIASRIAWIWYTGNDISKKHALRDYFKQIYNYSL